LSGDGQHYRLAICSREATDGTRPIRAFFHPRSPSRGPLLRARERVRRLKGGLSVEQPIAGDELRALKRHLARRTDALPWLFISERGQPLTRQTVNYLLAAAAGRAGLPPIHPHMLRHSCGFALANKGYDLRLIQDYLGHRDPRHTVRYTRTAARRFEGLWR
jgi:type 1 fimbriae regulatory protein FimB/type 1 fimbriae regulatory protein FimE